MKREQNRHSDGERCSCSTCVYKSESDHPSLRRLMDQGSRIDRLYYQKYIPLREQKLLERLVRTRAVYNDIRAQLLSDSTLSTSTKGDIKPRKKRSTRELNDTDKSDGAILHVVNMVDTVDKLGSIKPSDCCSCCSCSTKIQKHEHALRRQRQRRAGPYEYHTRERLGEAHNKKKGVRFKAKYIRSDPCTCTFKFSGSIKKHSKAILKKLHPLPPFIDLQPTIEEKQNRNRIKDIARTSVENLKQSNIRIKEKISEGINKMRKSQTRLQEKFALQTKKKLSQVKNKFTSKVKLSGQKIKATKLKPELLCSCPEKAIPFQVKKDSIRKFKEVLSRKQAVRDWECEPECTKYTCIPEECFTRLKQKRHKQKNVRNKGITYNTITQEKKTGETLDHSHDEIQTHKLVITKTIDTHKQKPIFRREKTQEIKGSNVSFNKGVKKRGVHKAGGTKKIDKQKNCDCEVSKETLKSNKTMAAPLHIIPKKINIQKLVTVSAKPEKMNFITGGANNKELTKKSVHQINAKRSPNKLKLERSSLELKSIQRQAVRIGSSFSFNIEFHKNNADPNLSTTRKDDSNLHSGIVYSYRGPQRNNKIIKRSFHHQSSQVALQKSLKDATTDGHALKRCFCTLKLKAKATKTKIKRPQKKRAIIKDESTTTLNSYIQPCTFDCTPDYYCQVKECKRKLKLNSLETNNHYIPKNDLKLTKRKMGKQLRNEFNLHAYECERGICIPGDCDPYQCINLINLRQGEPQKRSLSCECPRKFNNTRKTKSTSSFTSQSYKPSPAKHVQSMVIQKSDGSKSQYTIERKNLKRRNSKPTDMRSLSRKPIQTAYRRIKLKEHALQGNTGTVRRKSNTTQMYKKERNVLIGKKLRRCFCTLELHNKDTLKSPSKKTITTGTESTESTDFQMTANKSTRTKLKYLTQLAPFECEPFTCIPGACDPYTCLYKFNKRNISLKEVGLLTTHPDTTSSSTYAKKPMKSAKIQYKPAYKEQSILVKTQKPKKYAGARQAVNIGSTFSFDMEFYKNKTPTKQITYNYPKEKTTKTSNNKRMKNEFNKINKLNFVNIDTRIPVLSKRHKSSLVRPLLKRCFCTLNLQKQWNRQYSKKELFPMGDLLLNTPKIYTVNLAMTGVTPTGTDKFRTKAKQPLSLDNIFNKNYKDNKFTRKSICSKIARDKKIFQLYRKWTEYKYQEPVTIESKNYIRHEDFSTLRGDNEEADSLHALGTNERMNKFINETIDTIDINRFLSSLSYIQQNQYNSLTSCFRQCLCTMNLKLENKVISKSGSIRVKQPFTHRLKPYECEQDMCVLDECNPNVCEKRISKRLMKKFSKKSSTEYSSRSTSNSTNLRMPKIKTTKQKINTVEKSIANPHICKKNPRNNKKQSVRVGSSFSFDIEFYKKISSRSNPVLPKYSSDINLSKLNTSRSTTRTTKNSGSQSKSVIVKTIHKRSLTKPTNKRCYYALKLQKKGRMHREFKHKQPVLTSNEFKEITTISRGQNVNKFKPLKIAQSLKPYECEPNICIHCQCDPYQCLEIMKKRSFKRKNELGTSAVLQDIQPVSSMTENRFKKLHKSRAVYTKPKKVTSKLKPLRYTSVYDYTTPLRETVRVGSSFSFNVEFFKDHVSQLPKGQSKSNELKLSELPKLNSPTGTMNSGHNKKYRHKQSQIEDFTQPASTLTKSFIQRCFCTAHLNKFVTNKDIKRTEKHRNSFLKNCFCILKKINRVTNFDSHKPVIRVEAEDKKKNTRIIKDQSKLYPYECLPDICIPDECDSYLCEKIIKKDANKNHFVGLNAETIKTRSVSSNSPSTSKKNVKMRTKSNGTVNKPNAFYRGADRKVVKLGSTFSFDIEFSKDHSYRIKDIKKSNNIGVHKGELCTENSKVNKKNQKLTTTFISHSSQVKKSNVRDHATGVNSFFKRCFCTLPPQVYENKRKYKHKIKEIKDVRKGKEMSTKSIMTEGHRKWRSNALMPFECEPNICIPYQCNPHEFENLIKLRQEKTDNRELEISTAPPEKMSIGTITNNSKRSKNKTQSIDNKNSRHHRKQILGKYSKVRSLSQFKQTVGLGSSISFNIEFYKDMYQNGFELQKKPKVDHYNEYKIKPQSKDRPKFNTNQTKIVNQVTRTLSTMTGKPPLKRCFCTLSLRKPIERLPLRTKIIKRNASIATDYKNKQPVLSLLPYECEQNVCVLGECNPDKCLERIKRRHLKNSGAATNYSPYKKIAIAVAQKKLVINKSQLKHFRRSKKSIEKEPFKQFVGIGSNFNFNIELYKENIPQSTQLFHNQRHRKFKEQKNYDDRGQYINMDNLRNRGSQGASTKSENKYALTENILNRCFCTLKLQKKSKFKRKQDLDQFIRDKVQGNDVYDRKNGTSKPQKSYNKSKRNKKITLSIENVNKKRKYSTVTPFLKRCMCVFKIHKIGSQEKRKSSFQHKTKQTQPISKDRGEKRYTTRKLEPFECEPNFCVPGYCDPYKCEKSFKKRLLRVEGSTETEKTLNTSTFRTTNDHKLKPVNSQILKTKSQERKRRKKKIVQKTKKDINRQVVRLGSKLSFDIDFFKTNYPKSIMSPVNRKFKNYNDLNSGIKKAKSVSNNLENIKCLNRALQSANTKKESKSFLRSPFLKKCFCVFKLQKIMRNKYPKFSNNIKNNVTKYKPPKKATECKNVATNTFDMQELCVSECKPYFHIPGECNPYECERRIKLTEKKNTTTQIFGKHSSKSVGIKPNKYKSQRNQTSAMLTGDIINSGIVEIPRFANIFDKQAIKVKSNFSFNIEFYKENLPQTFYQRIDEQKGRPFKNQKNINSRGHYIKIANLRSHGSPDDNLKTENISVEPVNILKRCFCTLKLQNKSILKNEKQISQPPNKRLPFQQTLEVRTVAVHHKPETLPTQTYIEVKSVATKIDKKHLTDNAQVNTVCNSYTCKSELSDNMKTILPYVPKRFNKTISKTVLCLENNGIREENKPNETIITNRLKKLTRKKSRKHLQNYKQLHNYKQSTEYLTDRPSLEKPLNLKDLYLKSLFRCCAHVFKRKTSHDKNITLDDAQCKNEYSPHQKFSAKSKMFPDRIKTSKSERQTIRTQLTLNSHPKKSKSLMLGNRNYAKKCKKTCPYYTNRLLYQRRDNRHRSLVIYFNINKKEGVVKNNLNTNENIISKYKQPQGFVQSKTRSNLFTQQVGKKNKNVDIFCIHCLKKAGKPQKNSFINENASPLKIHFGDTVASKNKFQADKRKSKNFQNFSNKPFFTYDNEFERVDSLCKYCYECGRKINKEEFYKAAGDQLLNEYLQW